MGRKKRTKVTDQLPPAVQQHQESINASSPSPGEVVFDLQASISADHSTFPTTTTTANAVTDEIPHQTNISGIQIKSASMMMTTTNRMMSSNTNSEVDTADDFLGGFKPASQYGLHSHSGDLVEEDIYVSDGSVDSSSRSDSDLNDDNDDDDIDNDDDEVKMTNHDDEDDDDESPNNDAATVEKIDNNNNNNSQQNKKNVVAPAEVELLITTSKMGLMRRGGMSSLLGAAAAPPINRTWVRKSAATSTATHNEGEERSGDVDDNDNDGIKESMGNWQDENDTQNHRANENDDDNDDDPEDESNLDPAQRLALQKRKIERAKVRARYLESSENAGRDPCLFSKRTAFDIRMDQIEDKPWDKGGVEGGGSGSGGADITDYFNYDMTEEDWLEYSERQLAVRQELTDAARQKRLPDPGIVSVVPRAPRVQGDRVAVRIKKKKAEEENEARAAAARREEGLGIGSSGGGVAVKIESEDEDDDDDDDEENDAVEFGVELGPFQISKVGDEKKEEVAQEAIVGDDSASPLAESINPSTLPVQHEKVIGGAWGAGAAKDSILLRLIAEQSGGVKPVMMPPAGLTNMTQPPLMGGGLTALPPPPPPPPPPHPPSLSMPPHNRNMMSQPSPPHHHHHNQPPHHLHPDQQWQRDEYQQNNVPRQSSHRDNGSFNTDHPQQPQMMPLPQHHQPHKHGGRGGYQHQTEKFGGGGGYQQQHSMQHGTNPFHQQQHMHMHRPPPNQYHRGGPGRGGPLPIQQGRNQHPQGQWGPGGGGGGLAPPPWVGNGGPPGNSAPPTTDMNRLPPPQHGQNSWAQGMKRPRTDFGGDPRGDARRGRW